MREINSDTNVCQEHTTRRMSDSERRACLLERGLGCDAAGPEHGKFAWMNRDRVAVIGLLEISNPNLFREA